MVKVERSDIFDFMVHLDYESFEIIKAVSNKEQISIEVTLGKIIEDAVRKYINDHY